MTERAHSSRIEPALRHVAATVHGRYLVQRPAIEAPCRWFVGFHGYAQNAEIFLDSLVAVPGSQAWWTVSVQALHPFYNRADHVVANWMTRQDREHAIADNIAYVDRVLDDLEHVCAPPAALVVAGFSQGVAMAYRAGVLGRRRCDAILAVAGDLPPELASASIARWPRVSIVVGDRETYYTADKMKRDVEFLQRAGADVRARTFAGGHEWSRPVLDVARELLADVTGDEP
jgi:predicted esterase